MSAIDNPYDDNYAMCLRTYCTMRIYTGELEPDVISDILSTQATRLWRTKPTADKPAKPFNAWFLTTRGVVDSRESRRHLDYLLAILDGKQDVLDAYLQDQGHRDIVCFWQSSGEQGGPKLDANHARTLGQYGFDVSWNIYYDAKA